VFSHLHILLAVLMATSYISPSSVAVRHLQLFVFKTSLVIVCDYTDCCVYTLQMWGRETRHQPASSKYCCLFLQRSVVGLTANSLQCDWQVTVAPRSWDPIDWRQQRPAYVALHCVTTVVVLNVNCIFSMYPFWFRSHQCQHGDISGSLPYLRVDVAHGRHPVLRPPMLAHSTVRHHSVVSIGWQSRSVKIGQTFSHRDMPVTLMGERRLTGTVCVRF